MVRGLRSYFTWLIVCVALLAVAGCGKPAPPPPGAPEDAAAPSVDLGTPSGPQDSAAGAKDSTSGNGAPAADQGEKK